MTLDETIAHAREKAKEIRENLINGNNLEPYESYCDAMIERCAEEHEQLAEWLELLKWYQQGMEDIPSESGVLPKDVYHAGYERAIDDFAKWLVEHKIVDEDSMPEIIIDFNEEQLKEAKGKRRVNQNESI